MGVRREKVILELEDRFTSEMARAAAQTALLRQEVERLERQRARDGQMTDRSLASYRRLTDELRRQQSAMAGASNGLNNFNRQLPPAARNTRQLSNEINTASGRLGLLASAAITLGPALIPATAAAIPAVTGLANQLGIAALAAGTAVVAFQGVGDALKAVNEYDLEPTAANLEKVGETFGRLDRDAQAFTLRISAMRGQITALRDAAASGFFPPLTQELGEVDVLLERVESLLFTTGRAAGMELAAGLESMNGDRWQEFFGFLDREAVPTMHDLAQIIGNSGHALTEMWMAFQPLNRDFGDWLVEVTADWDRWAQGLAESESFEDFVDYIQDNGPRVAETVGALAGALADVVVAAAPLGGPALEALEAVADVVSTIASSDIGTPLLAGVAAMTLLSRTTKAFNAVAGSTMAGNIRNISSDYRAAAASGGIWARQMGPLTRQMAEQRAQASRLQSTIKGFAAGGAALAGLGIAASGAADGIGLTNTVSLGLMGTIAGPWGAAIGAGVGLLMDLSAASDAAAEAQRRVEQAAQGLAGTLDPATGAVTGQTRELLKQIIAAEGVDDTLQRLGYTSEQMVSIITGQSDGYTEMYGRLTDMGGAGEDAAKMLSSLSEEMADARDDQISLAEAAGATTEQYDRAARAIDGMAESYKAWSDTLTAFDAETAVGAALQSLRETFRQTGEDLDTMTESGQAFRSALSEWSSATQELIDTTPITQQGFVLEQQVARLAEEMGVSIDTAWRWANEVGVSAQTVSSAVAGASAQLDLLGGKFLSLPSEVITEIATYGIPQTEAQVDALVAKYDLTEGTRSTLMAVMSESAELQITNYRQMLASIPSSVRTRLIIEELRSRASSTPTGNWLNNYTPPSGRAGGQGAIRRAEGGYVSGPGGPREDAIPAWLSNGEYVVNAKATLMYRPVLEAINDNRFADGGLVGNQPPFQPAAQRFARGGMANWADTGQRWLPSPAASEAASVAVAVDQMRSMQSAFSRQAQAVVRAVESLPAGVYDGARAGVRDDKGKFSQQRKVGGR